MENCLLKLKVLNIIKNKFFKEDYVVVETKKTFYN